MHDALRVFHPLQEPLRRQGVHVLLMLAQGQDAAPRESRVVVEPERGHRELRDRVEQLEPALTAPIADHESTSPL